MDMLYEGTGKYVFISYSHRDDESKNIIDGLIRHNCRIWYDADINPGEKWDESIKGHITNSSCFLVFLSNNYLHSEYCKKELSLAISLNLKIIVFCIEEEMIIFDELSDYQVGELYGLTIQEKIIRVLKSLDIDVLRVQDKIIYQKHDKSIFFQIITEDEKKNSVDKRLEIATKDGDLYLSLLKIDTPDGIDLDVDVLNVSELTNPYLESCDSITSNACIHLSKHNSISKGIDVLADFLVTDLESKNPHVYLTGIKIISPLSGRYESRKTIVDLKNESNEIEKQLIEVVSETMISIIKEDDETANPLEKRHKESNFITVGDLLANRNCFRIPDYQRGYAWIKEFDVLWDDILRVYKNSGRGILHYTGMLALKEMDDIEKRDEHLIGKNAFYVVDGQQRLTSIIIIVKSLLDYIEQECSEDLSGSLLQFDNTYRFNYSNKRGQEEIEFFKRYIYEGEDLCSELDMYLQNIYEAKQRITEKLNMFDGIEAKAILRIILNKLKFNTYFNAKGFEVRVTFETMNNRGKQLTTLEKLKNRLMYLSSFLGSDELGEDDNSMLDIQRNISNTWKTIYQNLRFNKDTDKADDDYLVAHWFVYHGYSKHKTKEIIDEILEKEFGIDSGAFHDDIIRNDVDAASKRLSRYVDSLGRMSAYWYAINCPYDNPLNLNSDEKKWLDSLNRIRKYRLYIGPALMGICSFHRVLNTNKRIKIYKTLERSLFIQRLLKYYDNKDNYAPVVGFVHDLFEETNNEQIDNNRVNQLYESIVNRCTLENDREVIVQSIDEMSNKLKNRNHNDVISFYDWKGIQYFLYEYNDSINRRSDNERRPLISSKESIEHILPQTHSENIYWVTVLNGLNENDEYRLVNSLGNLTLISSKENILLSNFSYPTKVNNQRAGYRYGTRDQQTIANDNPYWTPNTISLREELLFTKMYDRWISRPGLTLTINEFLNLLREKGMLFNAAYNDISDETKEYLDSLSFENEQIVEETRDEEIERKKIAIRQYFKHDLYKIEFVDIRRNFHRENLFRIVFRGENIEVGIMVNGVKYDINYIHDGTILEIFRRNSEDINIPVGESNDNPDAIRYFIRTFKRFARRYLLVDNLTTNHEDISNEETNVWIVPCNPAKFDIDSAFNESMSIDFIQRADIAEGSIVYVYKSQPAMCLAYKCAAERIGKSEPTTDYTRFVLDSNSQTNNVYMELKLMKRLNPNGLVYNDLKEHGLKDFEIQGPFKPSRELLEYIDSVINEEE